MENFPSHAQELGDYSSTKGSGSAGAHSCQHSPGKAHRTPGLTSLDHPGKSLTTRVHGFLSLLLKINFLMVIF